MIIIRKILFLMPLLIVFLFGMSFAESRPAAFPGAEGGGSQAIGGRGGRIIEVTNLKSEGPGSFRNACEDKGPRIVIFRVAGSIDLDGNPIIIKNPYITIAGQTSPGGGILIKGHEIRVKTHDVIIRYIRIRTGRRDKFSYQEGDALAISGNCYNVIIDHCSLSWSNDENAQIWSGKKPAHNITFSWNLIAEGLKYNHPSCGLIVGSDTNPGGIHSISIHHNLFMNGHNRFPLVKCRDARIINNIIYNWKWFATGISGGIKVDIIGNKFKMGPITPDSKSREVLVLPYKGSHDHGVAGNPSIYMVGNQGPNQQNPKDDNWRMLWMYKTSPPFPPDKTESERHIALQEYPFPTRIHAVSELEKIILQHVGAWARLDKHGNLAPNRDEVDKRLIYEYINSKGMIPVDEHDVGGFPEISHDKPPIDTDHDGMPDIWENINKLNPYDPSDANVIRNGNSYTNIERYINGK